MTSGRHVPHVPRRGGHRSRPGRHRACMVPVAPDMKVETESPTAKRMQEGILELLLANHPLDCPVCDKGGECPLQDQAFSHGPGESRYVEEKRHYEKPIPISDLVLPRPRALHPVRPLHPLRRRGGRRRADPLHQPRQQHADQHVPRRAVRQLLQRQHRADLPGRRAHRQAVPLQGPPVGPRRSRRAPAPRARSAAAPSCRAAATSWCATWASTASRSTRAGCATRVASTSRPSKSDDRVLAAAGAPRRRVSQPATSWNAAHGRGRAR